MALWCYVLLYSPEFGDADDVRYMLDNEAHIYNWVQFAGDSFIIVSDLTAGDLASIFRLQHGRQGHFLVLDTAADRNGWLPRSIWNLMRNPRPFTG